MAAWLIASGNKCRAVFSYEFENIYMNSIAACIAEDDVLVSLARQGAEGGRKVAVKILSFRYRGNALEDLSLMEFSMWYKLKDISKGSSTKPANVKAQLRRRDKEQAEAVTRDEHGTVIANLLPTVVTLLSRKLWLGKNENENILFCTKLCLFSFSSAKTLPWGKASSGMCL
jgi:hypothetical protein